MKKKRSDRQEAIRDIVRNEGVRTQRALVDSLRERGFTCTQATISRDIAEMGLCKLPTEGTYVLAEDLHLQRMVHDLVVDVRRANNLVVIHVSTGAAQVVADALDSAELSDVLGSVAGDDTILVITSSNEEGEKFEHLVERLRSGA
ncbi:MAG: arginine repressor [Coriobacteriia bacterium]|nr:arginine repressor [Coriobacteriia bacterium]MBS5477505.1 arginine repressor [Coriobacteriia bacterium]